jgi:RNA polymerase sigma-70 factor (ECF subfamily)
MDVLPDSIDQEPIVRVEAAKRTLPRRTCESFILNWLDHMPYEEIARRTSVTVRQVGRHVVRALVLLDREVHRRPRSRWKFWGSP